MNKILTYRTFLGFSRIKFGEMLGITEGSVRLMENNNKLPNGARTVLLHEIGFNLEFDGSNPIIRNGFAPEEVKANANKLLEKAQAVA